MSITQVIIALLLITGTQLSLKSLNELENVELLQKCSRGFIYKIYSYSNHTHCITFCWPLLELSNKTVLNVRRVIKAIKLCANADNTEICHKGTVSCNQNSLYFVSVSPSMYLYLYLSDICDLRTELQLLCIFREFFSTLHQMSPTPFHDFFLLMPTKMPFRLPFMSIFCLPS